MQVWFMFKIANENPFNGDFNPLAMRNLFAVFAQNAVNAAADCSKAQNGCLKLFHKSS